MTLRMCYPHDFAGLNYFDETSNTFAGPMSGLLVEVLAMISQAMRARIRNATLVIKPGAAFDVPDANSENFEGCINALQSNRSDLLITMTEYPLDFHNVSQGLILYETFLQIGSMYQKTVTEVSQVLDSFEAFSIPLWFMCVITFVCLFSLLRIRQKVWRRRRNAYNIFYTATHLVRLGQMNDKGLVHKIIFLCASLFSLIVVHYFSSFIKTELVTMKDPTVFRSYQDIMDRKAQPLFYKGMSYDTFFYHKDAPAYRRKLWKYAKKNFKDEDLYVEMSLAQFVLSSYVVLLEQQVIIVDSLAMPLVPASGCQAAGRDPAQFVTIANNLTSLPLGQLIDDPGFPAYQKAFLNRHPVHFDSVPDLNFFTAIDPNEKGYTLGMVTNEQMVRQIRRSFHSILRSVMESGLHLKVLEIVGTLSPFSQLDVLIADLWPKQKSRTRFVLECAACRIIQPDTEYHPLDLSNFTTLLTLVLYVLPVLLLILLLENCTAS